MAQILMYEDKPFSAVVSGGGHTIKNDSGTELSQRDKLQFKGIYTHDDSTNNQTVAEIVREFNSVDDIEELTGETAKGFEVVENSSTYIPYTASDIDFDKTGTSYTSTDVDGVLKEVDNKFTNSLKGTNIISGYLANNATKRLSKNVGLIFIYRASTSLWAIVSIYGNNTQTVVGTLPSTITITSHSGETESDSYVDIASSIGYTIGISAIMNHWTEL